MNISRHSIGSAGVTIALVFAQTAFADDSPAVGELYVDVGEAGGAITLDGAATNFVTPSLISEVPIGFHQIEVSTLCGHAAREVEVRDGRVTRVELELELGLGELRLSSMPGNSQVLLDGEPAGSTPIILRDLSCGDHELSVSAEGYLDSFETVEVGGVGSTRHHVLLTPMTYGDLVVHVAPMDAEVWVDDAQVATGPVTVEQLLAGEHSVSVRKEGYITIDVEVEVPTDSVADINVELEPIARIATGEYADLTEAVEEPMSEGAILDATGEDSAVEVAVDVVDGEVTPEVEEESEMAESDSGSADTPLEAQAVPSRSVASLAINSSVTAAGIGLSAWGAMNYSTASGAYSRFLGEPDDFLAGGIYDKEVVPAKNAAILFGSLGGATLGAAIWLWLDTDYTVAVSDDSLSVIGRW
jgi:hypothetical protein